MRILTPTRDRVLHYIETHQPQTVMQVVRATGTDRRHVYRILTATYGHEFRSRWHVRAETVVGAKSVHGQHRDAVRCL